MKRAILCLAILLIAAAGAQARPLHTSSDVGGGGWLQSAAFHPTDADVILVGTDVVSGVSRTDDSGGFWYPWNDGITNDNEAFSMYVEDMIGITENGQDVFYAATHGGLYRADADTGPWVWEYDNHTPPDIDEEMVVWQTNKSHRDPISFSCLDWNGGDLLVAGAGRVRWSSDYEVKYYPNPDVAIREYEEGCNPHKWSVWVKNLTSGSWSSLHTSDNLGTVRDISVARVPVGAEYHNLIVAATTEGIYLFDYEANTVETLSDRHALNCAWEDASGNLEYDVRPLPYNDKLEAWSIHITERGDIYAAFNRLGTFADAGSLDQDEKYIPAGVYRLFEVNSGVTWPWCWVGLPETGGDVSPYNLSMLEICTAFTYEGPATAFGNPPLVYLTVVDGEGAEPDELFLGARQTPYGLFRGHQDHVLYDGATPLWHSCDWEGLVGKTTWNASYHPAGFDRGWINGLWGIEVIFEPAVAPGAGDNGATKLAIQFNGCMHVSDDGGVTWDNAYSEGGPGAWSSSGYNEHCTRGLGFTPDGRVIMSNGDTGAFISNHADLDAWEHIHPTLHWQSTPQDDMHRNAESDDVEVRGDWLGGGRDAIFINYSDTIQKNNHGKLFLYFEDTGTWDNITKNLPDLERYIFFDMEFVSDSMFYVIYREYTGEVGASGSRIAEWGILQGRYYADSHDPGVVPDNPFNGDRIGDQPYWHWTKVNDGIADREAYWDAVNEKWMLTNQGQRLLLNAYNGSRLFVTISRYKSHGGGLMELSPPTAPTWDYIIDGRIVDNKVRDLCAIAQSADHSYLYVGSRGMSGGGGALMLCTDPSDAEFLRDSDQDNWHFLANDPWDASMTPENRPFQMYAALPFWHEDNNMWSASAIDGRRTFVQSLAVDPTDRRQVYVGLSRDGFSNSEGLWHYDGNIQRWRHESANFEFIGQAISVMGFNPAVTGQFVFGTNGRGLYYNGVDPIIVDPPEDPYEEPIGERGAVAVFGGEKLRSTFAAGRTQLLFTTFRTSDVTLEIFDVSGRLVRRVDHRNLRAGSHALNWDGRNNGGVNTASGVYFARVRAGGEKLTARFVRLK